MGSLETDDLKQVAVLWAKSSSVADDYGRSKITAPVEIACRWLFHENMAADGKADTREVVVTAFVDRRIEPGGIMWLGELTDLPTPLRDLMLVTGYEKIPDIKARYFRHSVKLSKHYDTLPTIG